MYKILVADDEPDVLSLLKDYFEMNGYEVITAKNGREAVENMKKCPDMVLLDVNILSLSKTCPQFKDSSSIIWNSFFAKSISSPSTITVFAE